LLGVGDRRRCLHSNQEDFACLELSDWRSFWPWQPPAFTPRDDDDDKVPEAEMKQVMAALKDLGCEDGENFKKEAEGVYEIDDAKCKMGTMDIKLDKDFKVILISRY
jgi:hypothetical protein